MRVFESQPTYFGFTLRALIFGALAWALSAAIAWVGFELNHCLKESHTKTEHTNQ